MEFAGARIADIDPSERAIVFNGDPDPLEFLGSAAGGAAIGTALENLLHRHQIAAEMRDQGHSRFQMLGRTALRGGVPGAALGAGLSLLTQQCWSPWVATVSPLDYQLQSTGGRQRLQPVFSIVSQARIAL